MLPFLLSFWITANSLDAISTEMALHRCWLCVEANPILGKVGPAGRVAIKGTVTAAISVAIWKGYRSHRKSTLWFSLIASSVYVGVSVNNWRIYAKGQQEAR